MAAAVFTALRATPLAGIWEAATWREVACPGASAAAAENDDGGGSVSSSMAMCAAGAQQLLLPDSSSSSSSSPSSHLLVWRAQGSFLDVADGASASAVRVRLPAGAAAVPSVCCCVCRPQRSASAAAAGVAPGEPSTTAAADTAARFALLFATTAGTVHRALLPSPAALTAERLRLRGACVAGVCRGQSPVSLDVLDDACRVALLTTAAGGAFVVRLPPLPGEEESEEDSADVDATSDGYARFEECELRLHGKLAALLTSALSRSAAAASHVVHAAGVGKGFVGTASLDSCFRVWSLATRSPVATLPLQFPHVELLSQRIKVEVPPAAAGDRVFRAAVSASSATRSFIWLLEGSLPDEQQQQAPCEVHQVGDLMLDLGVGQRVLDFALFAGNVWLLLTNPDATATLLRARFGRNARWDSVPLEEPFELPPLEYAEDPARVVLDYISFPGRMESGAIVESLRRMLVESDASDSAADVACDFVSALQRIPSAVREFARRRHRADERMDGPLDAEEMLAAWTRYGEIAKNISTACGQPLGIGILEGMGTVCVVRRSSLSLLRECSLVETCAQQRWLPAEIAATINSASSFAALVGPSFSTELDTVLSRPAGAESPIQVANGVVADLFSGATAAKRAEIQSILDAPQFPLMDILSVITAIEAFSFSPGEVASPRQPFATLETASLVVSTAWQICEDQLAVIKKLFLFGAALSHLQSPSTRLPEEALLKLRSELLLKLQTLMTQTWIALWALKLHSTQAPSTASSLAAAMEAVRISSPASPLSQQRPASSAGQGGLLMVSLCHKLGGGPFEWRSLLSFVSRFLSATLNFSEVRPSVISFCKHLLSHGQPSCVPEFIRLMDVAAAGSLSLCHMAGLAHLKSRDWSRALGCFCRASIGVGDPSEPYLSEWASALPGASIDESPQGVLLEHYFMRCIELLERSNQHAVVVQCAQFALAVLDTDSKQTLCSLWSVVFNHAIEIPDFEAAYLAALATPNRAVAEGNMRQFVTTALAKGVTRELLMRPFPGFVHVVAEALRQQARFQDVVAVASSFYETLYIFFTLRKNFRAAAHAMFEYGQRLSRESRRTVTFAVAGGGAGLSGTRKMLEKEQHAYLAALNSLRLVSPKSQWLHSEDNEGTRPTLVPSPQKRQKLGTSSASADPDDDAAASPADGLTTIRDLERLCALASARVRLARHAEEFSPVYSAATASAAALGVAFPEETIMLLAEASQWCTAVSLAEKWELDMRGVFVALAQQCAVGAADIQQGAEFADETNNGWDTLRHLLDQHGRSEHYLAVAEALCAVQGASLPVWLAEHLEQRAPASLLRVLTSRGQIRAAIASAVRILSAESSVETPFAQIDTLLKICSDRIEYAQDTNDLCAAIAPHLKL